MKKSFSLVELLIALIIMSLLFSAFIPLVTKKLKASDITVGSFNNNEGQVITCKDGYHELNGTCYLDIENCTNYDSLGKCIGCNAGYILSNNGCYLPISNCKIQSGNKCSECNTNYEVTSQGECNLSCNCTNGSCSDGAKYCTSCNSGYTLYNNQCVEGTQTNCYDFFCNICTSTSSGTCTACKDGYTLYNGKCYFGNLEGCVDPTYDDTYQRIVCASCSSEYSKCNSGSCRLTTALNADCPANTRKVGCTCVAKYNIGDGKYGESLSGIQVCNPSSTCTITNSKSTTATARTLEAACWDGSQAKTAGTCNANYGGYSGCNRTLCNWRGGYEMCNSIGWRMPTMPELIIFASTTHSSKTLAENGLMFCDYATSSSIAPICNYREGCVGSYNNRCYPDNIWSSSFSDTTMVHNRALNASWHDIALHMGIAYSVRCVKDL